MSGLFKRHTNSCCFVVHLANRVPATCGCVTGEREYSNVFTVHSVKVVQWRMKPRMLNSETLGPRLVTDFLFLLT